MSTDETSQSLPDIVIPPEAERLLRHLAVLLIETVRRRQQQPVVQSESDTEQEAA